MGIIRGYTFGSGGVLRPGLVFSGLTERGISLILDRTSVPESMEKLRIKTTKTTQTRSRKIRRFPRSKPAIALGYYASGPALYNGNALLPRSVIGRHLIGN